MLPSRMELLVSPASYLSWIPKGKLRGNERRMVRAVMAGCGVGRMKGRERGMDLFGFVFKTRLVCRQGRFWGTNGTISVPDLPPLFS